MLMSFAVTYAQTSSRSDHIDARVIYRVNVVFNKLFSFLQPTLVFVDTDSTAQHLTSQIFETLYHRLGTALVNSHTVR